MAEPIARGPLAEEATENGWARAGGLTGDGVTVTDAAGLPMWRDWSESVPAGTAVVSQDRTEFSTSPGERTVIAEGTPPAGAVDLTHVRSSVRVSGEHARELLMRLTPLDLTPDTFPIGAAARTRVAGITAEIVHDAADTYLVVASRSFVASLWHAIGFAAEEWGWKGDGSVRRS